MRSYIQILRPFNLLIVGLTQILVYSFLFLPVLTTPNLSILSLGLLVLSTMLVAASGYVINDIVDRDIDALNKPKLQIVGVSITVNKAKRYYEFLVFCGFGLSIFVAKLCGEMRLIWLYPLLVFMLWAYSKYWKGKAIIGNLVVSVFTGFVPGILLVAERVAIKNLLQESEAAALLFLGSVCSYILFAFLSNMMRELIKDIEDVEGDRNNNLQTLPIILGVEKSKWIATVYGLSIISLLFFFNFLFLKMSFTLGWTIVSFLLIPMKGYILLKVFLANVKDDFSFISKQLKLFMVLGLLSILFISHFIQS